MLALMVASCQCTTTTNPPPPAQPQGTTCPAGDNSCPSAKTDAAKPADSETKTSAAPKAADAPAIVQQPAPAAPAKS